MPTLPTNLGVKYSTRVLRKFWEKAVTPEVTNKDYEGEIKGGSHGGDRLKILQFLNNVTLSDYTGAAMTTQIWLGDVESSLIVDQKKYYNFEIDNLDKFEAYVNDLDSALLDNAANVLQETIDAYVLGLYTEVKAGHRVGSDFSSTNSAYGDVGVATVVTGTGATTITDPGIQYLDTDYLVAAGGCGEGLEGLGISFDAGVTWYKISAWTDSVTLTVTDWNDSTYTGGTKTSVEFIIEAVYPKNVSKTTIYADICSLKTKLDNDKIPQTDRSLIVPPDIVNLMVQASELIPAVAVAYEDVVLNGMVGKIAGFKVYSSTQVSGDATKGWRCIASHKGFITFAHAYTESRVLDAESEFAKKYQGLNVYGAKVTIERRKAGACAYWIIAALKGDDWLA